MCCPYAADGSGNPTGSVLATTATDGNGYYRFDGLPAGTYVPVVDVNGSGWALSGLISSPGASPDTTSTGDVKDHGQDTPLGSGSVLSGGIAGAAITLGAELEPAGEVTGTGQGAHGPSGDAADNLTGDFGFCQPVTIGNWVWVDSNGNGVQDSGELGSAGVTLTLTGTTVAGVAVTDHATTGSDGSYLFTEPPGTYTVTVDASNSSGALAGYTATATGQGTAATDSNVNPSRTTPAGLTSGSSDLTVDFGFYQPVTIGNLVWNDANANGVQDAGEVGIAGVTVTLTGTDGAGNAVSVTTTSDANGLYQVTELPGTYTVAVVTPAGYTATATGKGTPVTDSNPSPSPTTLAEGQSDETIDFGFYQPVTIGDYVWNDANANGIQDAGEAGISGVTVTLSGTDGAGHAVSASTTTDANGHYQFSEPPGTYTVAVSAPAGYTASPTGQGTTATDSNPSPSPTSPATVASGGSDETVDFGFYQPVTVGDYVWHDANGNGVQDAGELGIANVGLTLSGTRVTGAAVTAYTMTDAEGKYLFTEMPGTYTVSVDATNYDAGAPLAGYMATAADKRGDTAKDSNTSPSGTTPAALAEGGSDLALDFGFAKPVTIGNFVWLDSDGNGVQDAGEPGISGVTLTLSGTDAAGDTVTDHATTDANGHYQFTGLPGTFAVTVSTPTGYTPTATGQGTVGTDSNPDGSSTTLAEGQSDQRIDFGFYQPVTIGDYVWNDANANGIQDGTEPGIPNVPVTLTGTDGANHAVSASTTTDVNGHYQFSEPPGTYTVAVSAPSGYVASPMGQGTAAADSNPSPSGTTPATLVSGGSDETVDFGFYTPSPTAATFAWLGAYVDQGQVWVTWQTYSESGLLGFDVGRSTGGAEEQLVTLDPVMADGRSMGYHYTIADSSARLPGEYTYRLVGYRDDGSTEELARVKVSLAADASVDSVRVTGIEATGDGVRVRWVGGQPPYVLESSPSLGPDAAWSVVGPAEAGETEALVPPDGQSGFFRIRLGEQ